LIRLHKRMETSRSASTTTCPHGLRRLFGFRYDIQYNKRRNKSRNRYKSRRRCKKGAVDVTGAEAE
jgi:hypothetical protein